MVSKKCLAAVVGEDPLLGLSTEGGYSLNRFLGIV